MQQFPVLNYHGIESRRSEYGWQDCELPYVISREIFQDHLRRLKKHGFTSANLPEFEDWALNSRHDDGKKILLTFDDGHRSHYDHVLPLLRENGFQGLFFVSAGWIGRTEYMGDKDLRRILEEGSMIGSHGFEHIPLPGLSDKQLDREIGDSKRALEDLLGFEVSSFSIPRGYYSPSVARQAKKAGYRFLFTSHFGMNRERTTSCYYIKRMALTAQDSVNDFERIVSGRLGSRAVSETCKEMLRRSLGPAFYDRAAAFKALLLKRSERGGHARP